MKVIIAGGRDLLDPRVIERAVKNSRFKISMVLCGTPWNRKIKPVGADQLGAAWALLNGVPVWDFFARWAELGRAAGPVRNREMAQNADALIACWDQRSRGTETMIEIEIAIEIAIELGLPRHIECWSNGADGF
jgi:hypothetical protein